VAEKKRPTAVLLALPVLLLILLSAPLQAPLRNTGIGLVVVVAAFVIIQRPAGVRLKDVGLLFLAAWATFFAAGAAGELLGIGWLQDATDFKKIFLR